MLITSPANAQLRRARRVRAGREPGLVFVEGERLAEECLQSGLALVAAFHPVALSPRAAALVAELARRGCPLYPVTPPALAAVSDTVSPQGMILLAARPESGLGLALGRGAGAPLVVGLDALQDPGNVGTIVRTAEAAGARAVVALAGTADPFAPKALRGAMGSAFRLPIPERVAAGERLAACRAAGVAVVATAPGAAQDYTAYDWRRPSLLLLGNEARGLGPELLAGADVSVRVPLRPPVESLNVAAAAAAILFEAARQRSQI